METIVRGLSLENASPFAMIRIDNFLNQLGFFRLAYEMKREVFSRLVAIQGKRRVSTKELLFGIFAAIWLGDRGLALGLLGPLKRATRYRHNQNDFKELEWYLHTWRSEEKRDEGQSQFVRSQPIAALVGGKSVLVMGPGPRPPGKEATLPHHQVAIVSALNGLENLGRETLHEVKAGTKILYWVPARHQKTSRTLTENQLAFLESFDLNVQLNGWCQGVENSVRSRVAIMEAWGLGHKAQAMIFDALKNGARQVYVTGVDSFAGKAKYHSRIFCDWQPDSLAATIGLQEASWDVAEAYMFALHDGVFNRRLLANLFQAGVIKGDDAFQSSCRLSDDRYLDAINRKFGRKFRRSSPGGL